MSFINAENGEGSVLIYDSGVVAAGAAITTGILDLRRFRQLLLVALNADAATRNINYELFLPNATTSYGNGNWSIAVAGNVPTFLSWGGGWASGSNQAGIPPGFLRLTMLAGGATTGRMVIWGR